MVAYTAAAGDLETGVEGKTVVLVEKKSAASWIWKVSVASLVVALCLGGVLLFAWCWNGGSEVTIEPGRAEPRVEKAPAEKTDPHYPLQQVSNRAKAAIHLEGSLDKNGNNLVWKNGQGHAFAQGGFRLGNNQITIPHTGLFFVYSQASFRVSCNGDEESESHSTPLSHRILRYSDSISGKTPLMGAIRTVCQSPAQDNVGGGWFNAIYLGAVFKLNKGDRLWTVTNQMMELETNEGQTFFGVFAL